MKCSHTYEEPGKYQVLVKVVDIFGNDTNKLLPVCVPRTGREVEI